MQSIDDGYKTKEIIRLLGIDEAGFLDLRAQHSNISLDDFLIYARKIHEENIFFDGLKQTLKRNLEAFKHYRPSLYEFFKDYKPQESFDFILTDDNCADLYFAQTNRRLYNSEDAKAHYSYLIEQSKGDFIFNCLVYGKLEDNYGQVYCRYFNEAIDKSSEFIQERSTRVEALGHMPHLVLMGVGLGYIFEPLYKNFAIDTAVIIEPDTDLFYASLYTTDYASVIENLKEGQWLEFIIGKSDLALVVALHAIYTRYGNFLFTMSVALLGFESAHYQNMLMLAQNQLKTAYTATGYPDDIMFGFSHSIAHLAHNRAFVKRDVHLPDEYKESRVFVIGNGPSLDNDIAFLRKNQDKAYIIACGTAIDTLYNLGIKPDMYVATERINGIAQTLDIFKDTDFLDDIVIAATSVVHPDTAARFKHAILFSKYTENIGKLLKDTAQGADFEDRASFLNFSNPLVGNAGLDVALTLGFKHIYLLGLDNGRVLGDDRLHSAHSELFNEQGLKEQSSIAVDEFIVEGNFSKKIVSNTLYKNAADCMALALSVSEDVTCYNLSDGAVIAGTIAQHSEDIDLSAVECINKVALSNYFLDKNTFTLAYDKDSVKEIFATEKFNMTADRLSKILSAKFENRSDLLRVMQECNLYLSTFSDSGSDYINSLIFSSACTNFFEMCTAYIYTIEDESKALLCAQTIMTRLLYLIDDLTHLYGFMPDYIQDRHIELLHGKLGFDHADSNAPVFDRHFYIRPEGILAAKRYNFVKKYK
ncbi:Uncharacterized protein conserved in bacteria [Anaerobiospirillum thomasii]|uniref:motility associated factor glycosyltransferase family protein n=1 Tax=Anaerobiospirillum thomasii TaxID=179995 RepID=UPI000D97BE34|nr:6-hydroxymethylpterin diphosphokinase MptE-like protein [Anaerobiospirillum thomasii]SPT71968.1 Uncharacterized protein conserved in bacteria [Anaerobiospirillum thomasii]